MSRPMSNMSMIRVEPSELRELISARPAIEPSDCSNGVATVDAMVSGLAPGMLADTVIIGKSICGSGATGSRKYDSAPVNNIASVANVVATGRMMKTPNHLMRRAPLRVLQGAAASAGHGDQRTGK